MLSERSAKLICFKSFEPSKEKMWAVSSVPNSKGYQLNVCKCVNYWEKCFSILQNPKEEQFSIRFQGKGRKKQTKICRRERNSKLNWDKK